MLILFYGNQEYSRYSTWKELHKDLYPHTQVQSDVYNGGYVLARGNNPKVDWYRCDMTPVLLVDVPKRLRMLQLVLNL
jgi:hypothetical protein